MFTKNRQKTVQSQGSTSDFVNFPAHPPLALYGHRFRANGSHDHNLGGSRLNTPFLHELSMLTEHVPAPLLKATA